MNVIREIHHCEIPRCVEVIRKSFATVAKAFHLTEENAPRFTAFATTEERLYWQLEHESRKMYGYFANEEMIGYCSLLTKENNEAELNNLCVLPRFRHGKIGEALLRHCIEVAQKDGCAKITIGIVEENTKLRQWYERYGFEHTGTEKFPFFPFTCGYMECPLPLLSGREAQCHHSTTLH